jgi:hypothetical protein
MLKRNKFIAKIWRDYRQMAGPFTDWRAAYEHKRKTSRKSPQRTQSSRDSGPAPTPGLPVPVSASQEGIGPTEIAAAGPAGGLLTEQIRPVEIAVPKINAAGSDVWLRHLCRTCLAKIWRNPQPALSKRREYDAYAVSGRRESGRLINGACSSPSWSPRMLSGHPSGRTRHAWVFCADPLEPEFENNL